MVMLAASADGRKLPPLLILKRKTLLKSEAFLKDVIVRAQDKGWMTEELMLEWLKIVWGHRPRTFLNQPSILVLDAFKGHLTDSMKNRLRKMKTELVVIPGGMTSVLQPMDVSINKPFKDRLRQQYDLDCGSCPRVNRNWKNQTRTSFRSRAVGVGCTESHPGKHYHQIFQEVLHKQCFGCIQR